jgi:hypothetical protein
MPGLKNDWVNGDLFTPAAANDMANAVNLAQPVSTPTAIKTAAYTAAVGELVPADAASGGFTVTLPAAPASGSTVWVKKIDTTTNTVTVQRGNSTDVFNETNGPTLLQLAVAGESVQVQYKSGIWYVVAHSFAVPGLDKRYVQQGPHPAANSYSINDLNGASVLAVIGTADAANHLQVENSTLGNRVRIRAEGEDNVNFEMRPKGTGGVFINSGAGNDLVGFVPIASAVNSWSFNNSTTGNPIRCAANGSNASVSFNFVPKGSGNFQVNGTAVLLTGGELGTPSSGTLTNCTFPTLNQNTTGTAAGLSSTLVVGSGGTGATTLTGLVKGNGSSAMTAAVAGTDFIAPGGALGTPSSGTLTNATGLPVSGITASTSAALGVGSIELGHATDTTVTRSAAGVLAVEGVDLVNLSSAQTLVGKTFTFHNQADRTTNFEQTYLGYSGNNFLISNTNGGTGSRRPIVFQSGATVTVDSGNSSSGVVRISASTGSAGNMAFAVGGTFTNSSGITYGTHLNHTMSQTGTGGYTSLLINPTELSNTGTGAKILIDAMVGGSSKFTVSNAGSVTLADAATLAVGTSTGTKIATATTQKLGFWNASPAVQPTAVADATDAATVITQLNSLLSRLRTIGLIAT